MFWRCCDLWHTYRTNKYNLIYVPFVDVKHHWKMSCLGVPCYLMKLQFHLIDCSKHFWRVWEIKINTKNYRSRCNYVQSNWKCYVKYMSSIVFLEYCKNAPSHLGYFNSNYKFQSLFNKCMKGCDSKEESEITWNEIVILYQLYNHQWLCNMYKIRHK